MAKKAKVEVFVTKTRKFRADITEANGGERFAVTINGEMWNQGKGAKYKTMIIKKIETILKNLHYEFAKTITATSHDSCEGTPVEKDRPVLG
jgi:hypothetical protein